MTSAGRRFNPFRIWHDLPLAPRIVGALVIGVIVGLIFHDKAAVCRELSDVILKLLRALVIPLIFVAVVSSLIKADISSQSAKKIAWLLVSNTLVAISIGLVVVNIIRPGNWAKLAPPTMTDMTATGPNATFDEAVAGAIKRNEAKAKSKPFDPWAEVKDKVPDSIVGSFTAGKDVISVIFVAIAFGVAFRRVRTKQMLDGRVDYLPIEQSIETLFECMMIALHWIIDVIPLAVFGVVAAIVGQKGFAPFVSLGAFVVAVVTALILQVVFYLTRVTLSSWVRPREFIKGGSEALMTAFATASSTATMPLTYACLKDKVGVRDESASMGALVGSNFNNDGTALYEAMAPLFIAQALGMVMPIPRQIVVAFMAVIASVGAPGIPEAGLVTMLLVFTTVGLPIEYVPLLLTVDWFLDRCRTAVNVMGDMTVSCILDGKSRATQSREDTS
ncbi:MAG: dicarboxylate/amino acid:cation symporter [Chthonomonadales bacterium]